MPEVHGKALMEHRTSHPNRPSEGDLADRGLEVKYALQNAAAPLLLQWLEGTMIPDPEYRQGRVSSIYYDTPSFDLYGEKASSDYIKTKLRLRWYGEVSDGDPGAPVPSYLEVKRKVGSVRQKLRRKLSVPREDLRDPWSSTLIGDAAGLSPELGFHPPGILQPAAIISYVRYRFMDEASRSRISLDMDIGCPDSNPHVLPSFGPIRLDAAVLEVKGLHDELIPALQPMRHLFMKSAFSKYARCLELLAQPQGSF